MDSQPAKKLKGNLILLVVAIIWGSAFVAQRIAAPNLGIFTFNGLRFLLASFILLPFVIRNRSKINSIDDRTVRGIVLAGILLWSGASLQQAGLRFTTAANAGFITSLYVVLIPIMLSLFFRRSPTTDIWVAAFLGAVGLFLISTAGKFILNPGDGLELIGALFWAMHVILIAWLVQRINVFYLAFGQYLVCGTLGLFFGFLLERNQFPGLSSTWWVIVYTGIFSVALGYTLQIFGQKHTPPAHAAIILSSEAVFAALFGWLMLNETLTIIQLLGCGLILTGIIIAQHKSLFN